MKAGREERLLRHVREGLTLAERDGDFLRATLTRLRRERPAKVGSLWDAIPWAWCAALGDETPADGPLGADALAAGRALRAARHTGTTIDDVRNAVARAVGDHLDVGALLRSHPFAELGSWLLRTTSRAS